MRIKLLIIFLFPLISFATNLKGVADWAPNKKVILEKYSEFFLYSSEVVLETQSDDSGKFSFEFDEENVGKFRILIEDVVGEIYMEAEGAYDINIRPYNGPNTRVLSKEKIVGIKFSKDGALNINRNLEKYNRQIDEFIQNNAAAIIQKRADALIITFKENLKNQLSKEPSKFVVSYVTYALAQLEMTTNYARQSMMEEYILDAPILYNNPQYASFFLDFFIEFFRFFAASEINNKLNTAINLYKSADSLYVVLETNRYFRQLNNNQKELLVINEVYFQADNKKFNKGNIGEILNYIHKNTKNDKHKVLLSKMLQKFNKLKVKTNAPNFEFTTFEGETKKLSDLKGKYVYLDFWASWCKPCIEEMAVMENLYDDYGNQIEFLSISIDKKKNRAQKFLKRRNFNWSFGHTSLSEVKSKYDVRVIPMYYLIDPEGKLIKSPAARPTGDIERAFYKIKKESEVQNTKDLPSWKIKPKKN